MMALLAIGTAVLMTAVGVAIGGLALELILFAMSRNLQAGVQPMIERTTMPAVIHLKSSETSSGAMDWAAEEVAA